MNKLMDGETQIMSITE